MTSPDRAALRCRRIGARLRSWPRAVEGVAAVEFALILPIMVTLFLGMSEVTLAVNIDRKLTLLSRSLADLSSRTRELTTTEMSNVFGAASAIMRPFDSPAPQMVVSSIGVTKSGSTYTGAVEWSCGRNLAARAQTETEAQFDAANLKVRAAGSAYAVPEGFKTDATKSFILVETLVPYTPVFGYVMTGTIRLRENTPWPVRDNDRVVGPSSCPA
ncbi:TadE/TadG family type IV pilus assembly protein [Enterovirga sp.]|jgi:Flp pilus assembly protein TadG|uniref:TadE/TadG family type IV pilus assembly protein n=1 Tax=Enterovirga sp. TaxID=2026350 RepID=UPI002638D29A|nr:TadE/TadG family type IV pilus assembly protein [Enterovirga sp.]MDB5589510.1 hypothetical protein [Enterovirga sp.]